MTATDDLRAPAADGPDADPAEGLRAPAAETASTEITPHASADMTRGVMSGTSIAARIAYARELAVADLIPGAFRKKPANVLYAIEYGNMLGIHPLAAMTGVHVMDGKPTASSALMSALVRRAGHKLRVKVTGTVEGGDLAATATIVRSDDPDFTFEATWTLQRGLRAGLVDRLDVDPNGRTIVVSKTQNGKPSNWEKFPEAMVKARAISEVAREACEEALCGVHYTPEELGAIVDEDENVVIEGSLAPPPEPPPAPPPPVNPDELRADVLAATNRGELMAAWFKHGGRGADPGPIEGVQVADENGAIGDAVEFFKRAGAAITAGEPLRDNAPRPLGPPHGDGEPPEGPDTPGGGGSRPSGDDSPPGDAPAASSPAADGPVIEGETVPAAEPAPAATPEPGPAPAAPGDRFDVEEWMRVVTTGFEVEEIELVLARVREEVGTRPIDASYPPDRAIVERHAADLRRTLGIPDTAGFGNPRLDLMLADGREDPDDVDARAVALVKRELGGVVIDPATYERDPTDLGLSPPSPPTPPPRQDPRVNHDGAAAAREELRRAQAARRAPAP